MTQKPYKVNFGEKGEVEWGSIQASYNLESQFGITLVVSESDKALHEAQQRMKDLSKALYPIQPSGEIIDEINKIAASHKDWEAMPVIWIQHTDKKPDEWLEALREMNPARGNLDAEGPVFIVLAGGVDLASRIADAAPDLWAIISPIAKLDCQITVIVSDEVGIRSSGGKTLTISTVSSKSAKDMKDLFNVSVGHELDFSLGKELKVLSKSKNIVRGKPVTWLHLSDLHLGCSGRTLWWQVHDEFSTSLHEQVKRVGPPDVVLISGDLTYKGRDKEFQLVDQFLTDLKRWLHDAGAERDPLILPVPGNHDLARPSGEKAYPYLILERYDTDDPMAMDFKKKLWEGRTTPALIKQPFKAYTQWFRRSIQPQFEGKDKTHTLHVSRFPGDYTAGINIKNKVPFILMGLNSAWMQYSDAHIKGKLELPLDQFHLALSGKDGHSGLRLFDSGIPALLMMHHPPGWLSEASRLTYHEAIYTPDRFRLCLFGHMHAGMSESISIYGGKPRYFFQSPSLFGLRNYGSSHEQRSIGYSFGRLSSSGEVKVWPITRMERRGSTAVFVPDLRFKDADKKKGSILCPAIKSRKSAPKSKSVKSPLVAKKKALELYCHLLMDLTDHINIAGIGSGAGAVSTAARYSIESLYVPLKSNAPRALRLMEERRSKAASVKKGKASKKSKKKRKTSATEFELLHESMERRVELQELLAQHDHLFIEGQPGSGKTTFLRFIASMLARDHLEKPMPDGGTWRKKYLGMDSTAPPLIPILVKISDLSAHLGNDEGNSLRIDNRRRMVEHLVAFCKANHIDLSSKDWVKLLSSGKAILLVDGLDETPDEAMRERLFHLFRDVYESWPKTQMVVTSRPINSQALIDMGFAVSRIDLFGKEQIRTFIKQWVAALHQVAPDQHLSGVAGLYEEKLLDAIIHNHSIRLLASNPIMLTCLCVVHWNETHLPEGRSRVYRAVIRWLIASRQAQRNAGFTDRFAHRGLARIALGMMCATEGRQVRIDLEHGARLVESLVERDYPDIKESQDRRDLARGWLRFECLGSGIVEELAGNRIQFWHLTFQEYLSALQLAWLKDDPGTNGQPKSIDSKKQGKKDSAGQAETFEMGENWWPIVRRVLHNPQWRETLDLLPGCLLDEGGEGRVDQLLDRVLKLRGQGKKKSLAKEAGIFGIISRILNTMNVYDYKPAPSLLSAFEEMKDRVLEIFTIDGSRKVPIDTRIEVAEALGQGGDPRLGPDKIEYLEIPGMPGKKLGKYPVTVEEYQRFVDARGYEERKYWDVEGWNLRKGENWETPREWEVQLQTPNRPVVRVSWYEACAYCRWLSEVRDREMRLPSTAEWEAAAKPSRGEYPWGDDKPTPELANFDENVDRPTPVGVYPRGTSLGGHMDLAGNVWEWCKDRELIDDEDWRALRGGCYWSGAEFLRCPARDWRPAGFRNGGIGFRVLSAPASTVDG